MGWGSKQGVVGLWGAVVLGLSGCSYDFVKTTPSPAPTAAVSTTPEAPSTDAPKPIEDTSRAANAVQSGDVWERLNARFRYSGLEHPVVRKELLWFQAQPKVLERVSRTASPYLYFVAEEIDRRDIPGEIALLPILESGYQPEVKSPNGAAGLWQFMRDTGTRLSLGKSKWYDGRMDVTASTRAALDYLSALKERFGGDWLTAIAAYNAGWGNVERAVEQNRRRGRPTDFWSLELTPETRQLVGRTLALSEIIRRHGGSRTAFQSIPNRPYFTELALDKPIDLRAFVRQAGISEGEFRALNPGFRTWHTGPDAAGLKLLVPVATEDAARRTLAALAPSDDFPAIAEETDERRPASSTATYVVRNGDSIWTIAKRHNVKVADLISANRLPQKPKLKLGQKLSIPGRTPEKLVSGVAAAKPAATAVAPARSRWAPAAGNDVVRYRVREGDSLWTISRRFKVTVEQLLSWNNLDHMRQLQPGQEILVYSPS